MERKIKRVEKYTLCEYLAEKKEEKYLEYIKEAFKLGDIDWFLKSIKKAERWIRSREKRITYRLIRAARMAKINIYGQSIDIFEKMLMEKHRALYLTLEKMTFGKMPNEAEFPALIEEAFKLEESLIKDIDGIIAELNKVSH